MKPSIFRKRHEAEEITPIPGPLEVEASGIDRLQHLEQFEKAHKFDPNMPLDELNDVDAAIATGNAEKCIEIEHALMEDNSPYPEVRLAAAVRREHSLTVSRSAPLSATTMSTFRATPSAPGSLA